MGHLGQMLTCGRGVRRNFEKGFPIQLSDCYIRVVYSLYCLTALLEYLDLFTKIVIQNNAVCCCHVRNYYLIFN